MWFEFVKQNWLVFSIALLVLLIVVSFVKTMVKWAFVVLIVVFVGVYSGITLDNVNDVVTAVKDETVMKLKDQALQTMMAEIEQATFHSNKDGTFTIQSPNVKLHGAVGSHKVNVTFNDVPLGEWNLDDTLRQFVQKAKQNK